MDMYPFSIPEELRARIDKVVESYEYLPRNVRSVEMSMALEIAETVEQYRKEKEHLM